MVTDIGLTFVTLVLAGTSYGLQSFLLFNSVYSKKVSPTGFFGRESYKRKYKLDPLNRALPAPDNWYYRLFNLKFKERFPLSTTLLVFTTDAFHLLQFITFQSLFLLTSKLLTYQVDYSLLTIYVAINLTWKLMFGLSYYGLAKKIR